MEYGLPGGPTKLIIDILHWPVHNLLLLLYGPVALSWFGHLVKPFLRFDTLKKPLCKEYFLYIGYRVRVKWHFFR